MRTKGWKKKIYFLVFILGALPFSWVISAEKKTFRFRLNEEPITLDWNKAHTTNENYILMNIMEGLVELDSDLRTAPSLADRWNISDQGKTYTFHLREGVYWSDGVKLKAKDFVASWERLLNPKTAAPYAYLLFDIVGAEDFNSGKEKNFSKVGVKEIDDKTLVVHLKSQLSYWIYIPSFWVTFPIRKDLISKYKETWTDPKKMVSLGPYLLKDYIPNSKIILEKNKRYYGKTGNLEQIEAQIIKDDNEALKAFDNDKIDYTSRIPIKKIKETKQRTEFKSFQAIRTIYLGMVQKKPEFDLYLRKAIVLAIDKEKIAKILNGGQLPSRSFVPPGVTGYSSVIGIKYDVKKAKEELKKSIFFKTKKTQLRILTTDNEQTKQIARLIQEEIKKNLDIEIITTSLESKDFYRERKKHLYSLFIGTWGADYPDPDSILSIFTSFSGNNHLLWENKKYDELILSSKIIQSGYDREMQYIEAQKLIQEEETAVLPLYYDTENVLLKKKVKGLVLSPVSYLFMKQVNLE